MPGFFECSRICNTHFPIKEWISETNGKCEIMSEIRRLDLFRPMMQTMYAYFQAII